MMRLLLHLRRKEGISCARVQALVQSFIDGELEGPERDRLAAHLAACRPCGVEAATYERIERALAPEPPADSVERLRRFSETLADHPPGD